MWTKRHVEVFFQQRLGIETYNNKWIDWSDRFLSSVSLQVLRVSSSSAHRLFFFGKLLAEFTCKDHGLPLRYLLCMTFPSIYLLIESFRGPKLLQLRIAKAIIMIRITSTNSTTIRVDLYPAGGVILVDFGLSFSGWTCKSIYEFVGLNIAGKIPTPFAL